MIRVFMFLCLIVACGRLEQNKDLKSEVTTLIGQTIQSESFDKERSFFLSDIIAENRIENVFIFMDMDNQEYIRNVLCRQGISNCKTMNFFSYPYSENRFLLFFEQDGQIKDWVEFEDNDNIEFLCHNRVDSISSVPYFSARIDEAEFYVFNQTSDNVLTVVANTCVSLNTNYWLEKYFEQGVPPQKPSD